MHAKISAVERCFNKEIGAELLDQRVFAMIRGVMLHPGELRGCMEFFKEGPEAPGRLQRQLQEIEAKL